MALCGTSFLYWWTGCIRTKWGNPSSPPHAKKGPFHLLTFGFEHTISYVFSPRWIFCSSRLLTLWFYETNQSWIFTSQETVKHGCFQLSLKWIYRTLLKSNRLWELRSLRYCLSSEINVHKHSVLFSKFLRVIISNI